MKKISVILFSFVPLCCLAQPKKAKYLNDYNVSVNKERASRYVLWENRKDTKDSITWTRNLYYMNHQLSETCPLVSIVKDNSDLFARECGTCKLFYPDGTLKEVSNYQKGNRHGDYETYYKSGQMEKRGRIIDDLTYIYHYFDSSGKDMLQNGSGHVIVSDENNRITTHHEITDSLLISSYTIDTEYNDTVYVYTGNNIAPKEGWPHFFDHITRKAIPAKVSVRFRYETLIIAFTIMEDGSIARVKKLNSVSPEVDEAYLARVSNAGSFNSQLLKSRQMKVKVSRTLYCRVKR